MLKIQNLKGKRKKDGKRGRFLILSCSFAFCLFTFNFLGCAKRHVVIPTFDTQMASETKTFKGIAYIVAEKRGVKWASNVAILVKQGGLLRMDAIENITDIVATVSAGKNKGYLHLSLEDKWVPFENGMVKLPVIGEIPVTPSILGALLIGRPPKGEGAELEVDPKDNVPVSWTMFSDGGKKNVLLEASFGDYRSCPIYRAKSSPINWATTCRRYPQHVMIRFEKPKLLMDIRYKDMWPDVNIPDALFEIGPKGSD